MRRLFKYSIIKQFYDQFKKKKHNQLDTKTLSLLNKNDITLMNNIEQLEQKSKENEQNILKKEIFDTSEVETIYYNNLVSVLEEYVDSYQEKFNKQVEKIYLEQKLLHPNSSLSSVNFINWYRNQISFQYDQNINELKLFISYLKSYFSNILNEKKQLLMYQENIILNLKLWETINKTHIQDFQKNIQNYDELIQKNRQLSNQYYKQNNQSLYYQYTLVKMINFFIIILIIQLIIYYFGSYYYSSTSR